MGVIKIVLIILLLLILLATVVIAIIVYIKSTNGDDSPPQPPPSDENSEDIIPLRIMHLPQVEQILSQFSKTDLINQKITMESEVTVIGSKISKLEAKLNPQDPLNTMYIDQINIYKNMQNQLDIAMSKIDITIETLDQIEEFDSKVVPLINSYNLIIDKSTADATLLKSQIDALTSTVDTLIANLKGI